MRPRPALSLLITFGASRLACARTRFYDPSGAANVRFVPPEAWQPDPLGEDRWMTTTDGTSEASFSLAFAGEQISLYGLADRNFTVWIDGREHASEEEARTTADTSVYARMFLARQLSRRTNHSLTLEVPPGSDSTGLVVSRIGVSYATESGLVPALLPLPALDTGHTRVPAPTLSSGLASSAEASVPSPSEDSKGESRGGVIVGGVVGALFVLAIVVTTVAVLIRRRRSDKATSTDKPSARGPNTERQSIASSLFGGFGGPTAPGDFSSSPLAGAHLSHPYAASSSAGPAWVNRLARASSWKRKAERLPETRRFYGLGEATGSSPGLPSQPPPCVPLPSVPIEATREMEERWRTAGPTLSLDAQRGVAHSTVQVYGQALSNFDDEDHSGARSLGATDSSNGSYVVVPYPRACVSSSPPRTAQSFHNPFESPASHESHGSLSSAEGAFIREAHPISVPLERADRASSPLLKSTLGKSPIVGTAVAKPTPVRSSSKRDLVSTYRAGPSGAVSVSLVEAPSGGLARQPSLIRPDTATTAHCTGRDLSGDVPPASSMLAQEPSRQGRHQSSTAPVEGEGAMPEEASRTVRRPSHRPRRSRDTRSNPYSRPRSRSCSAAEEDRPGFFAAREHIPRYSVDRDPRLASGTTHAGSERRRGPGF
ncbi:hypothetical protein JCM3774_006216 [Rhodotorula dairenensis]